MKVVKVWVKLFIIVVVSNFMASSASGEELSLGNQQAPVTIIEYGSLTCGNCLSFHKHVYPELKKEYIDTGTVRFVFRHFPTGGSAVYGARAANCSGDKYYEMLDKLFSTAGRWVKVEDKESIFIEYAASLELDSEDFTACIRDKEHLDDILLQQEAARDDLDVNGTPTFFINEKIVRGKRSFPEMKILINEAIIEAADD